VCNTDAVTFNGQEYSPFPFKVGATKHTSKGEIPSVQFQICNVNRVIQAYIEQYDGLISNTIIMRLVHADNLSEDYAELTLTFEIISCHTDAQWATFDCGAPNPMRKRFPLYRYIGSHCNWSYGGVECGMTIAITGTTTDIAPDGGGYLVSDSTKHWVSDSLIGETFVDSAGASFTITDNGGTWLNVATEPAAGAYSITTTCARTLDACETKGNSGLFGGYKGLVGGGVRVA
jgi:phage-related protein